MSDDVILAGKGIEAFKILQVIHGLSIEIVTGMKLSNRGSALDYARKYGIIEGRTTKKAALKAAIAAMKKLDPQYEPKASVQKALDK